MLSIGLYPCDNTLISGFVQMLYIGVVRLCGELQEREVDVLFKK